LDVVFIIAVTVVGNYLPANLALAYIISKYLGSSKNAEDKTA